MPADAPPSAVVRRLERFAPRTLLTARMLDVSPRVNEWLDRYMTEWRHVRPRITGDDLRALGLPPGPVYTRILDGCWRPASMAR
jgi:tRNA nucleotidyltransferase (CCA-adding enzyme)